MGIIVYFQGLKFISGKDIELHTGFERRYLVSRTVLHKKIEKFFPNRKKIVSIGHSLGGALAGICAADLAINLKLNVSLRLRLNGFVRKLEKCRDKLSI